MIDAFLKTMKEKGLKGEIFKVKSYRFSVSYEFSKLKGINEGESSGFAVRVMKNGKVGFSYGTRENDLPLAIDSAIANTEYGESISYNFAGESGLPELNLFDREIEEENRSEIIDEGKRTMEEIKSIKEGAQAFCEINKFIIEKNIATTEGFQGLYRKTLRGFDAGIALMQEGNFLMIFQGTMKTRKNLVNAELVKNVLRENFLNAQTNVKITTGQYPVIFTPFSVDYLFLPIGAALNGRNVVKGNSIFKGKLEEQVFNEAVTISDEPLIEGGAYSSPFDDEGTARDRHVLIENGVLKNYLTDLYSGSKLGTNGGNASRDFTSQTTPEFTNVSILPSQNRLKNFLIDKALIIYSLMGVQMGNVLGGEINGNIELGFLVENGNIVGRVKDAMLSFNILDALKNMETSRETEFMSRYNSPYVYIPAVSVATK